MNAHEANPATSAPTYDELAERYEMLRARCNHLSAEHGSAEEKRGAELLAGYALSKSVSSALDDLAAWRGRLNPWTAQGWQFELLSKMREELGAALVIYRTPKKGEGC